jgi:hypothetical protein
MSKSSGQFNGMQTWHAVVAHVVISVPVDLGRDNWISYQNEPAA